MNSKKFSEKTARIFQRGLQGRVQNNWPTQHTLHLPCSASNSSNPPLYVTSTCCHGILTFYAIYFNWVSPKRGRVWQKDQKGNCLNAIMVQKIGNSFWDVFNIIISLLGYIKDKKDETNTLPLWWPDFWCTHTHSYIPTDKERHTYIYIQWHRRRTLQTS